MTGYGKAVDFRLDNETKEQLTMHPKPQPSFGVFDRRSGRVISLYGTRQQAEAEMARRQFADGTLTRYEVRDLTLAVLKHG